MLEHELLAERVAVEGVPLLLLRVGVVAAVETRPELGVAEDLVRLVDGGHLLLRLLFGEAALVGLVRVVQLGQLAVGRLDLPLVGVARHAQHLVVVLGLAALELNAGLLEQLLDQVAPFRGQLRRLLERPDGGLVVLGLFLRLGLVQETVHRVLVQFDRLLAVLLRLFAVHLE